MSTDGAQLDSPSDQPVGRVALVFTDIQGSTEAWERLGDAYQAVLGAHNSAMRRAIASCSGYEVKTEGDAFMVAFHRAGDAVRFCMTAQRELAGVVVTDTGEPVRVRMGVHVGEPICEQDPVTGRMDYFGPMVNRSARVSSAAHGEQTLITESARADAGSELDACRVVDLGKHRLKGLERLEHLYEITPAESPERVFPPVRTLTALPTNLPPQATSFIGRRREWAELSAMLTETDTRLITLTGPGGIGKTRLTIRVGGEVLDRFEGGVWFVEVEEATDAEAVGAAVSSVLGVPAHPEGAVEAVASALEVRPPTVIVIDNFEQVVEASAETLGVWMKRAPKTKFIVSSRALLSISGEQEYPLEPLADPRRATGKAAAEHDAIRLFVDRAQSASPKFQLTPENTADIAEICAQLDGIPLAIELAAARAKVMKPAQIRARLSKRFQLLRSSRRDVPDRQKTLEGAIAWSYDLLEPWERSAFCQACVFRGGFTLESAEAVLDLFEFEDAPLGMDAVQTLREKSMLTWSAGDAEDDEGRFGMYVSVRDFGRERAAKELGDDEREALLLRHAEHYQEFVEEAEQHRRSGGAEAFKEGLDRVEPETENALVAVERQLEAGAVEAACALQLSVGPALALRGPVGRRVPGLTACLEKVDTSAQPALAAELHWARAIARADNGAWVEAAEDAQESLRLAGESEDAHRLGDAHLWVGELARLRGVLDLAEDSFVSAQSAFERAGEQGGAARAMSGLGSVQWKRGQYDEALASFEAARSVFDALENVAGSARCAGGISVVEGERGRREAALEAIADAEAVYRAIGDRVGLARTLGNKGIELRELGRFDEALVCLTEAESVNRQLGRKASLSMNLGSRAMLLEERGDIAGALASYQEGEDVQLAMGDLPGVARFRTRRAHALARDGRTDDAETALEEAIAVLEAVGGQGQALACEAHGALALIKHERGAHDEALGHAHLAEAVRTALGLEDAVYRDPRVIEYVARVGGG